MCNFEIGLDEICSFVLVIGRFPFVSQTFNKVILYNCLANVNFGILNNMFRFLNSYN